MELSESEISALVRISVFVGLHDTTHLRRELQKSIRRKVPVELIREAILQSYLFAGYAAAINAFITLNEIAGNDADFLREPSESLMKWKSRGKRLCRKIYGQQYEKLIRNMKSLHPDLAEWMLWEGYGKVLSRPFLSPKVRELLIVGMTAALGAERQFHSHVRGALHVGATPGQLKLTFRQVGPFLTKVSKQKLKTILERLLVDDTA